MPLARKLLVAFLVLLVAGERAPAQSPEAKRGQEALLSRALLPPAWSLRAFQDLWKQAGLRERPGPEAFAGLLRDHYGLQAPAFANDGLPMGLQKSRSLLIN